MKNFLLIIFSILFLTACVNSDRIVYQSTEKPKLIQSPLQGRWIVTKVVSSDHENQDTLNKLIGKDAIFTTNIAIFHTERIENPTYTMSKVNTDYFLKLRYNKVRKDFSIMTDNLFVIEIYNSDEKVFQVLREKEDIAYINIYGDFLQLVKTKEDLNEKQMDIFIQATNKEKKYHSNIAID